MKNLKIKIGHGFDVHKFCENRPLVLGGIEISYKKGLAGHSDADVLIHAIIDAIVSPTLHTDIGNLFPDSDKKYKNIDSKILLKKVYELIKERNFCILNIDCTIIAQEPKLSPYILKMRETLANILNMNLEDVTVKATTTENLGFTGRKEGIAATAVALILKND